MAEYYAYNETVYDNPQLERLNEVLDNMTDEELARHVYEIECQCEGLDPDHPDSPKRLKKLKRQYKWKHDIWPTIRNTACWMLAFYCAFNSGYYMAEGYHWGWSVFQMLGAIGWLNLFLTFKFGSDYIFKY
jgi:hypothetical protein